MSVKVSILITNYNHEDFLEECILSAITQDFEDKELLIVDDGSTDASHEIIERHMVHFKEVILCKENKGACVAVNQLLKRAKGEYVSILNSDDVFLTDKTSKQVEYLDQNPEKHAVFSKCRIIDETGKFSETLDFPFDFENRNRLQWLRDFFNHGNCLCHSTVMMRKSVFDEIGFYDERIRSLPDLDFWVRLLARHEIFILQEDLVFYRRCKDRVSESAPSLKNYNRALFETERILEHYANEDGIGGELRRIFDFDPIEESSSDLENLAFLSIGHELISHRNFGLKILFGEMNAEGNSDSKRINILKRFHDFVGSSSQSIALERDYKKELDALRETLVEQLDASGGVLVEELEQQLSYTHDKIRRMSESFSWKITSPIRFLRRVRNRFLTSDQSHELELSPPVRATSANPSYPESEFEFQPYDYKEALLEYDPDSLLIDWLIPDFHIGSGGHTTIFRIIHHLEKMGHRSKIWICDKTHFKSVRLARNTIRTHFFPLRADVGILDKSLSATLEGDCIFSTSFETCYYSRALHSNKPRFYLVQDYEPSFFPVGSKHFLAQGTYDFGFHCITAGKWLFQKVGAVGGDCLGYFDLAVDHTLFFPPICSTNPEVPVIAVYSRAGTERRLSEMVIHGLNVLAGREMPFKVLFFGAKNIPVTPMFEYEVLGVLKPRELAKLYRNSTIGCVFSATNYSLVPLEMMACGLPVVEFDGDNTQQTYPDNTVAYAKPDPFSIAEVTEMLLKDVKRCQLLKTEGKKYVTNLSWEQSSNKVEMLILNRLREYQKKSES